METCLNSASVHRFHGTVAAFISPPHHRPATVYLTPGEARAIAAALLAGADDCEARGFTESTFRPVEIEPGADGPRLMDALRSAESFISGFEDDDLQEGIPALLAGIREALALAGGDGPASPAPDAGAALAHLRAVLPYAESRAEDMAEIAAEARENNEDRAAEEDALALVACAAVDAAKAFLAGEAPAPAADETEALAALENAQAFLLDCPVSLRRDAVLRDINGAIQACGADAQSPMRLALESAEHWIEEQAWSPIAENGAILRVIRKALGRDSADASAAASEGEEITPPHTDEIGRYLRACMENAPSPTFGTPAAMALPGCIPDSDGDTIQRVDMLDPSNLRLHMESGAIFVVRIIREG